MPRAIKLLLIATTMGSVMGALDIAIVNMAIKAITADFNSDVSDTQWVSTAYLLGQTMSIPLVAWLEARLGTRRLWVGVLAVFLVASVTCGFAWSLTALTAFRFIQGVASGFVMLLAPIICMRATPPPLVARVTAAMTMPLALGSILGPPLAGVILSNASWRAVFFVNVPLAIAAIAVAFRNIPRDDPNDRGRRRPLDWVGTLLLVPGLACLIQGLTNSYLPGGLTRLDSGVPLAAGLVLCIAFVAWSRRRGKRAVMDIGLLRDRTMALSAGLLTLQSAAFTGALLLLPFFVQTVTGFSVMMTAYLLIPQGLGMFLSRLAGSRLTDRFGLRVVGAAGFAVMCVTTVPFMFIDQSVSPWLIGGLLFVRGAGLGTTSIPVSALPYLRLPRDQVPGASTLLRTAQQIGYSFGTALCALALQASDVSPRIDDAYRVAFGLPVGIAFVAFVLCFFIDEGAKASHS